jgi:hypothetical protein
VPSRAKSRTPRCAAHPQTRSAEPAERKPAWKMGEMPPLASLIATWLKPQQAQSKTMSKMAAESSCARRSAVIAGKTVVAKADSVAGLPRRCNPLFCWGDVPAARRAPGLNKRCGG